MVDTTRIADNIDGLADREFKTGGMKLSFGSIVAIFAFLSTVVGGLYGGFVTVSYTHLTLPTIYSV